MTVSELIQDLTANAPPEAEVAVFNRKTGDFVDLEGFTIWEDSGVVELTFEVDDNG